MRGPTQYPATNKESVNVATSTLKSKYSIVGANIFDGAELANVIFRKTDELSITVILEGVAHAFKTRIPPRMVMYHRFPRHQF